MRAEDALARFGSNTTSGLDSAEAARRLARFGRNELPATRPRRLLSIFADQFRSIVVALLLAAIYVPVMPRVLSLHDPGLTGWALILSASVLPALIAPLLPLRFGRGRR